MIQDLHNVIVATYVALPVAALVWAALRVRRRGFGPLARFVVTLLTGMLLGAGIVLAYAYTEYARPRVGQMLLAGYFATGLMLVLRLLERAIRRGLDRALGVRQDALGRPTHPRDNATQLAFVLRLVGVIVVALPYVMAALVTYRPKAAGRPLPVTRLKEGVPEQVVFDATDGTALVGWWVPAPRGASDRTVIVCHGMDGITAEQLLAARWLLVRGYNVFVFDFRAHGQSGGQLVSFGDRERADVLGAVRWLKANRGEQCRKLFGVGVNTGAAALIAAAADRSAEGQAIDAVAVYGCYDELANVARDTMGHLLVPPLRWLSVHVGLPLASVQVGADLSHFSPARLAKDLWPRPILVIHAQRDAVVDFQHGWHLYEAATLPKEGLWLEGDLNDALRSRAAAAAVEAFFDRARPVPAI